MIIIFNYYKNIVYELYIGLTQLAHKAFGIRVKGQGLRGATAPLRLCRLVRAAATTGEASGVQESRFFGLLIFDSGQPLALKI